MAPQEPLPFAGIDAPNTTPVPDVYFDVLFPQLGKAPLKVLLYLVRRIFGFKKDGDTVSLSQICQGIRRRDGSVLDSGTGLTRHAASTAIRELEDMGVIVATRGLSSQGDPAVTYYALRFRAQLSVHDLLQPAPTSPGYRFPGIDSPNTTPVPDAYFDMLLPVLGLAEWRVLLYVIRRTLGFKKLSDAISLDQFTAGITTQAGIRLDAGTGLSRSNVHEALNRLVMRHVLIRQRLRDARTGDGVSVFGLAMRDEVRRVLGDRLGMMAGPLRDGTTGTAEVPHVLPSDHPGVLPETHHGVLQSIYPGVLQSAHQGVLETTSPAPGQGQQSPPRVLRTTHPGVLAADHPASRRRPTQGRGTALPVGTPQTPQETGIHETAHDTSESGAAYAAIVLQIATDLGVTESAAHYGERVALLAASSALAMPDMYEALLAAWRITRTSKAQGNLVHPESALAYFYRVLVERTGHASPRAAAHAPTDRSLQDPRFVAQVQQRIGTVGDQTVWQQILAGLAATMTPTNFTRWFARSVALASPDEVVVVVPDVLQRQWLTQRLLPVVQAEAVRVGEARPIQFIALADLA